MREEKTSEMHKRWGIWKRDGWVPSAVRRTLPAKPGCAGCAAAQAGAQRARDDRPASDDREHIRQTPEQQPQQPQVTPSFAQQESGANGSASLVQQNSNLASPPQPPPPAQPDDTDDPDQQHTARHTRSPPVELQTTERSAAAVNEAPASPDAGQGGKRERRRSRNRQRVKQDEEFRFYMCVSFEEKDQAKTLRCRFDPENRLWYATARTDRNRVEYSRCVISSRGHNMRIGLTRPGAKGRSRI